MKTHTHTHTNVNESIRLNVMKDVQMDCEN